MKQIFVLVAIFLVMLCSMTQVRADLLDCEEEEERDFFKNVGCHIKKGATKVGEHAKKFGVELKESARRFGEKAKDLGDDIKDKFHDIKDKFTHDSAEEHNPRRLLANVEIINPDILKAEQQCGHGYIIDAMGNCSKARK